MKITYNVEKLSALVRLVSHILLENAIEIDYGNLIARATEYIDKNLAGDLSLTRLTAALFVSKNQLYAGFHSMYSKTVGDYITDQRIKKAKKLLSEGSGVQEVAAAVGIDNGPYLFTPLQKSGRSYPHRLQKGVQKNCLEFLGSVEHTARSIRGSDKNIFYAVLI